MILRTLQRTIQVRWWRQVQWHEWACNHHLSLAGGDKILLAAGGSVDPYWTIYQQHNHEHVRKILAELQIGVLDPKDVIVAPPVTAANDPYAKDPRRHPALIARSVKPFNAEPPAFLLADSFITPTEILFTRNHLPVPHVDATTYKLEVFRETVNADGTRAQIPVISLSLDDLKTKFEHVSVVAALQCAGNRRGDMTKAKETRGLSWGVAAMGNVEWRGVRLRDVLKAAGFREEDIGTAVRHLQFEGLDKDPMSSTVYAASIPADRGWSSTADVVLAFEMNGKPLTKDHGFPVRAVVPGVTGARQVKWLGRILASPVEVW
jgi:sulfite oxidase